jgi:hypothetical protein
MISVTWAIETPHRAGSFRYGSNSGGGPLTGGESSVAAVVITDQFAWAHLPKAAGDATHEMLCAIPALVRFEDPLDSNDKHMPFFGREREVAGKLLVMNIRRLPAWALSGAHHRAAHGEHPDYRPQPLNTADQISSSTDADDLLRWMTDHGRFEVDRWLRAESLADDLLALLSELGIATPEARRRVLAVGRVNEGSYERDLSGRFSTGQISRLYEHNPTWAAIERRVYGSLLCASAGVAGERPDLDR